MSKRSVCLGSEERTVSRAVKFSRDLSSYAESFTSLPKIAAGSSPESLAAPRSEQVRAQEVAKSRVLSFCTFTWDAQTGKGKVGKSKRAAARSNL
jgi:hypothetical protein